jgi:Spy/CpxP family protein refolding chaperone
MHKAFRSSWGFPHSEARTFFVGACGPEDRWGGRGFSIEFGEENDPSGASFGAFGVRRPLRFLAHKLGLDEDQIRQVAQILDELKTERAQAAVDSRRTLTAFADAVAGESFDEAKAASGAALRVDGAERLKTVVLGALRRIHALLRPEQREHLAYLIRTGRLTL